MTLRSNGTTGWCTFSTFAVTLALAAGANLSVGQTFTGLGFLSNRTSSSSNAVNADGSVVVGSSYSSVAGGTQYRAFRWRSSVGMQGLSTLHGSTGSSIATGVNALGTRVVGLSFLNSSQLAFLWTSEGGFMASLGTIPGGTTSAAEAISANGLVVTGYSEDASGTEYAMRWTQATGMISLGTPMSYGKAINSDGSVIAGFYESAGVSRAFRWTQTDGLVDIGTLSGGTYASAHDINGDGTVIVGTSNNETADYGFRWTQGLGMEELFPPNNWADSEALGVSADGKVVVGSGTLFGDRRALLWSPAWGVIPVEQLLTSLGAIFPGWELVSASSISADGTTISGYGRHNGQIEAWVAAIPPLADPCPADLNNDDVVDDADFSIFAIAYNILDCADLMMPSGCPADLKNDDLVDDADFSLFVVAYNEFLCP